MRVPLLRVLAIVSANLSEAADHIVFSTPDLGQVLSLLLNLAGGVLEAAEAA